MTTVYLIRHAEAEGNLFRRCHGQYDSTITPRGYRQIAALAKRFEDKRIDAVYSSDLTRTQTTALSITRVHGLPLRTTPELREVGAGVWEDRTWTYLARFDRERLVAFNTNLASWQVEGAERMADVRARMLRALERIVAAHPGETVAAFSHGMALRTLIGTLQGLSDAEIDRSGHAENTAVTKLEADENGIRVIYAMDASHLSEELTTLRKQAWLKTKDGVEPGIWFAPDAAHGRFSVMNEDAIVGAVAVERAPDGAAVLGELRLDEAMRGQNYGVRLVGQALSHARTLGCDTLRVTVARDNALAARRAAQYGFRAAGETAEGTVFEAYFGYDAAYREQCFDAAWQAIKKDG